MKIRSLTPLLLAGVWLLLAACDRSVQASGTSDETNSKISVSGRVFNEQSRPLGGVVVQMRHSKLSDTTNGDGLYSIVSSTAIADSVHSGPVDTLDYLRNGSVVYSLAVPNWVTTMPDVFLIQRNLSGTLTTSLPKNFRLSGILTTTKGDSISIPLEWSSDAEQYSGFAWSRFTGGLDTFIVQVVAWDSAGHPVGNSHKLTFTSLAGDIVIPSFDPMNRMPDLSIQGPTMLHRLDTARFRIEVTDSLKSKFSYAWRVGDGAWGNGNMDTLIKLPDNGPNNLELRVRVVRQDGLAVVDSMVVPITSFAPKVSVVFIDTLGYPGKPVRIRFTDSDTLGSKIVRRWIGAPWYLEVSGKDTTLTAPSDIDTMSVSYWVRNERGDSVSNNVAIPIEIAPPEFSPNGGDFDSAQMIHLTSASTNVVIRVHHAALSGGYVDLGTDGKLVLRITGRWWAQAIRGTRTSSISTARFQFPVLQGQFTDNRDGRVYKTVKIGGLVWMAENLKWIPDSANWKCMSNDTAGCASISPIDWKCLNDDPGNCDKFGPLYKKSRAQTVCPIGWHLSHLSEWDFLLAGIGADSTGIKLKSKTDWDGTNEYGFNALPGGFYEYNSRSAQDDGDVGGISGNGSYLEGASWHFSEFLSYADRPGYYYEGGVEAGSGTDFSGIDRGVNFSYHPVVGYRSVRCVQDSL